MTRINIVPVSELTDQHLVAEYREIFMVGPSLQRSLRAKNGLNLDRIPNKYTLNKGHVMFFYNKGEYLDKRYTELVNEMKARGMKPDPTRTFPKEHFPAGFYNDWSPNEEDFDVVRERIAYRISQKPGWYRMHGKYLLQKEH